MKPNILNRFRIKPLLCATAILGTASFSYAADQVWSNAGASDIWNTTDNNWTGTWVNDGSNAAIFGNATTTAGETVTLGENITANGLTVNNNNATGYTFNIGSGLALNVNGNVTIGANIDNSVTKATFSGLGAFNVGDGITNRTFQVGGGTSVNRNAATLDMSGLANFTASLGTGGIFRVGNDSTGSPGTDIGSTAILAQTSAITAGTLHIGTTGHQGTNTLILGSVENTIHADTINIGAVAAGRASGTMQFTPETEGGKITIRGVAGGETRADMNVLNTTAGTALNLTGIFDTTGHTADLKLGTLAIGNRVLTANPTSPIPGTTTGIFSFGSEDSKLDVQTITMGKRMFLGLTNAAAVTAELNLSGGEVKIGAFGNLGEANNGVAVVKATVNISGGDVTIGTAEANAHINMAVSAGTNGTVTSTINITGGTVTQFGNITRNNLASRPNATATLTLDGGSLDMTGHTIGGAGETALTNVNLRSGTLENVAQINNGGGLTKTTTGTLTIAGTNTYTGATLVSAGTLLVSGTLGNTAVSVGATGTIGGDGTLASTLSFADGAKFVFSLTETLTVNGASVTFANFGVDDLVGLDSSVAAGIYTLIDGTATVSSTNLDNLGAGDAFDLGDGKSAYFQIGSLDLVVIPEPAAALLGSLGMLALLRRRRA